MTTQCQRLETERDELLSLLNNPYTPTPARAQLTKELRRVVDEIEALDAGTHWTQAQGDTLGNIVMNELAQNRKKG
jgi:hypothetical protein